MAKMTKQQATKIIRGWAQSLCPVRWTVDNMMAYGTDNVSRAIRVLGADDAWVVCANA